MKKTVLVLVLILALFLALAEIQFVDSTTTQPPSVIDVRIMTYLDQMQPRLALYNLTGDWTMKIYPADEAYLHSAESTVYIEVYVSDVEDTTQKSVDPQTNETAHVYQVYKPREQVIARLSAIPHTTFYVSWLTPSICLTVEKQALKEVAEIPSVYCIRIIPSLNLLKNDNNPTLLMVSVSILAVVGLGLLIYFKPTKKRLQKNQNITQRE